MDNLKKLLIFILTIILVSQFHSAHAQCRGQGDSPPLRALYFTPDSDEHSFWGMQRRYTRAVAKSLNVDLNIIEIRDEQHNRFDFIELVKSHIEGPNKPELVLGIFYLNGEEAFLKYLDSVNTPFFSVNASLSTKNLKKIGKPREKFRHWIGHIAPDDYNAGFELAKALAAAQSKPHFMLAIAGENQSTVSYNRRSGLSRAQQQLGFQLLPPIHTNWGQPEAYNVTQTVMRRFPDINIIWAVGAHTAKGVHQYFSEQTGGRGTIKLGAFDWAPSVLNMILEDQIDISYGGHFREAGLALLLAYDYFSGHDFGAEIGSYIEIELKAATKDNAKQILSDIEQNWRQTNFAQFSKCLNPEFKGYKLD